MIVKELKILESIDKLQIQIDLLKTEKKDKEKEFLNLIDNLNKEIREQ